MENKTFTTKTALLLYVVGIGSPLSIVITTFFAEAPKEVFVLLLITFLILAFLLSIIWGTKYIFQAKDLLLRMSFFKKRVAYEDIKAVVIGNHLIYAGYKFATGWKNTIIIKYNKYDEVLISPKDVDGFVAELKKHVPELVVQ